MVYKFDPAYWNGTIFEFREWDPSCDLDDYRVHNKPIPAHCFPKSLTLIAASRELPDIFHTYRNIIVFSERARVFMEERVPGQVEFIPVVLKASPKLAAGLGLASAYYFINVLGRAQRLQWLDIPTQSFPKKKDGTEPFGMLPDLRQWKLRERTEGEPLIWHDEPLRVGKKRYAGHANIFIEDGFWEELNAIFPDQLNALKVGE